MKARNLFVLILSVPFFGISQDKIYIVKDTTVKIVDKNTLLHSLKNTKALSLSNGYVVKQGEFLALGKGTLPNGDFNYIATPSNTMEAKLRRQNTLKDLPIKEVIVKGSKRFGFKYIVKTDGNYLIQLEDALAVGEILLEKD